MITVNINGKDVLVREGTLILEAARDAGFDIPTFCYQADLMGVGSCRMCLVEVEGQKKLQPSCITPVIDGMKILTETEQIKKARQGVLEFFLSNHALDCPVCDKGGECELQDMVYRHGPPTGRFAENKYRFHEKDYVLSPVIIKNSNRCIQCLRCVRVCAEVVGRNALISLGRGHEQEETTFFRSHLDCDHCGNCIEVCPVGCFMRLPYRYKARPWDLKGADTICPYCATGCRMVVEERAGEVVRARAQFGVGINSETLCARGRFGFDYLNSTGRVETPLIRKFGRLEPATWAEAFEFIRNGLSGIHAEKIGGIASPLLTNEELYLFQDLMRSVIGSPNIDSTTRWDPAVTENFITATAMTAGGVSVFDVMRSDTLLVAGTHLSEENPVTDYIARRISAERGTAVVVASARPMKLDSSAGLRIRHGAGGLGALLRGAAASIYRSYDKNFSDFQRRDELASLNPASLAEEAGVTTDEIEALATRFKRSEKIGITAGTDMLRYGDGISALGLLRDTLVALGKEVLVLPVLDRANQRGAWEMGVAPGLRPGYAPAPKRGLGGMEMLSGASTGAIEALYIIGKNPVGHAPAGFPDVTTALSRIKFLVVQDAYMTETAEMAHCVLPGAYPAEKEGTFTNEEGRVQAIRRLKSPPGSARADLWILASLEAALLGRDVPSARKTSKQVFEEIRDSAPIYREVSLAFNNKRNNLNRLDIREALSGPAEEVFRPSPMDERTGPAPLPEGGFHLLTGNCLFHCGSLSHASPTLSDLQKGAFVEISAKAARALGVTAGQEVRVEGNGAVLSLTVRIVEGMRDDVAFIPEGFPGAKVERFFAGPLSVPVVMISKA